jgi:hypothetical protein
VTIFDLYSKRQKKLRGEVPDVYVYDDLPRKLRNQIVHIWLETLGKPERRNDQITNILLRLRQSGLKP